MPASLRLCCEDTSLIFRVSVTAGRWKKGGEAQVGGLLGVRGESAVGHRSTRESVW
jgi:hypothetical protein